jgi:hypothetical protein
MRTIYEVRLAAGALPMRGEVEQHGSYTATTQIVGKGAHEGRLTGPSMHQEHTRNAPFFGFECVRLKFANTGHHAAGARRAQMKARTFCQLFMIGAAMAR